MNEQPRIQKGENYGYYGDLADAIIVVYRMISDIETELKNYIRDTEIIIEQRVNMLLSYDHLLRSETNSVTKETLSR